MSIPEESVGAAVSGAAVGAVLSGDIGRLVNALDYLVEKAQVDAATAQAGGGDVRLELEELVGFYNGLSDMHTQLQERMSTLTQRAAGVADLPAGGSVAGVQAAWLAIRESMGAGRGHSASLIANMKAVDATICTHMEKIQQCAQTYAAQENYSIQAFGSAGSGGTGTVGAPSAAPPPSGTGKVWAI